jgi:phage N-6-adenine-methyltransferase
MKKRISSQRLSPALYSSQKMDWETPQGLFDRLNAEFHFEWDVCASKENAKCACFFTEKDNGLSKSWKNKTCWMNPPYGWEIGLWMAKAYQESREGATVVCLVPSRTDTVWWHDYAMKGEYRLLRGRLKFVKPDGTSKDAAPFPSAIVIFRGVA